MRTVLIMMLAVYAILVGEARAEANGDTKPLQIVATTGMVADIVRHVAGERADVHGLMGEGVDPHLYKPTRSDIARIIRADAVFYSGLLLEGRMTDTFVKAARRGKPVFAVTEHIDEKYLLEPDDMEGHPDPHVWMDVAAWNRCVAFVAEALAEIDPAGKATYANNAKAYGEKLTKLDAYAKQVISSVPQAQRVLVTAHDAFNYFGRAYQIEVLGIQGISTESEAGLEDINRLVDMLVKRKITAVFVESSVSDRNVKALIEGAKARGHDVKIGGELFSDAMGKPGTYEGTYIGMVDHNATTIARALGGEAPEGGFKELTEQQEADTKKDDTHE